jgi:uncharacterized protein YcbK (DUF882 family)
LPALRRKAGQTCLPDRLSGIRILADVPAFPIQPRHRIGRGARAMGVVVLAVGALVAMSRGTQDAVANGDTRTISIRHMHTKEEVRVTFRRNGRYDSEALQKLNWALRDWRRDEPTRMDPRLFDIAWEVHREVGSDQPFHVVSAYRSPETNSMLRRRSRGVAKHSQHTEGKAMDFYLPDVSSAEIRAVAMKMQRGGVGFYPSAYTPFIHLDVGSVRSWPRMTRDQLARLFPDGATVHIPADGKPMPGYEVAKADVLARGGTVGGYQSNDFDEGAIMQSSRRSLWASLFGWNEEDESRPAGPRARAARNQSQTQVAYAPAATGDGSDMYAVFRAPAQQEVARVARPARQQPAAEPAPAAPSTTAAAPAVPEPAPTPEPPRPAQPRLVDAPFPTNRPQGLGPVQIAAVQPGATGDRLNWQQGPQGAPPPGADEIARLVLAPAPPRRPEALPAPAGDAETGGRLVANAPQPPARPGTLTALALSPGASSGVLPATAPTDPPGRLVAVSHPAPPERPRLPGAPAVLAAAPASAPAAAPARAANPDRQALDNLFAAVATGAQPVALGRVTTTRARAVSTEAGVVAADSAPAAALGFSSSATTDAPTGRFGGPAVRPLPPTYTSR